ncbi:MAG: flagellar motor protein MotB [Sideroxydans sp.]|nr:flagellar motor protein MotB [Sideroxydans sp.]
MAVSRPTSSKSGKKKVQPIVIRRTTLVKKLHPSGTWKIAYADFVTAMMAFFLLMWLVGSNDEARLRGIAEYFQTPLMVAISGGKVMTDRSNVISQGSKSIEDGAAQVKMGKVEPTHRFDLSDGRRDAKREERARLIALKQSLEKAIDANLNLSKFKDQLLIDITTHGLRIQIIDKENRAMFDLGSANLKPYTVDILHQIGSVLNSVPNKVSMTGHTDARPYQGGVGNYSNWELSLDRANAARRELVVGGLYAEKFLRVVGLASSALFDATDPYSPSNRRISIIVMNEQTEKAASMDGGTVSTE